MSISFIMSQSKKDEDIVLRPYMTIEEIHEMNESEYQRLKKKYGNIVPERPVIKPINPNTDEKEFKKQFKEEVKKIAEYHQKMESVHLLDQINAIRNFEPFPLPKNL
jgi:hypothetical protein